MRILRVVLIVGVVLGVLFTGVDRWAVSYAENRLAERIQSRQGLAGSAEVDIRGFPFLTQALSHDLERVDLRLRGVEFTAEGRRTRLSELDASFHEVELNGDYTGGGRRAEGTGLITYADLTAASQSGATLSYGGAPGKVKVTAAIDVLGRTLTHSVVSTVTLEDAADGKGGKIVRVRADSVPGDGVPGVEKLIRRKTDFDRSLDTGLPTGLRLSALTADEAGVHLTLDGTDVVLAGS
ncbi:hypothetical protein SF23_12095 [Streptomyces sp. MBRL 10]|nr:hypothetical protein SF23_12095 [Streptomyces sp. MBRL 10]